MRLSFLSAWWGFMLMDGQARGRVDCGWEWKNRY